MTDTEILDWIQNYWIQNYMTELWTTDGHDLTFFWRDSDGRYHYERGDNLRVCVKRAAED